MALQISVVRDMSGVYRAALAGSLDTSTSREFDKALLPAYDDLSTRVIRIEAQQLHFISSMGIGILVKARKLMQLRGGVLLIVSPQPQVSRVLNIVRVIPRESIFASSEQADAFVARHMQTMPPQAGSFSGPVASPP